MENVVALIEKGVLAILALAAYICLVGSVYPWLCMRISLRKRDGAVAGVRGLRRVTFPEGRGVVYEPALPGRRYIPQYAIFTEGSGIYLRCQTHPKVHFLRYDALAFDARGRLLEALSVEEWIRQPGQTRLVILPTGTAYVRVIPREADDVFTGRERLFTAAPMPMIIYSALTVVTTVAMSLLVWDAVVSVLALFAPEGVVNASVSTVLVASVLCGLATAGFTVLGYFMRNVRVMNQ